MENKFYIYAHINPLFNKIFYIGKGSDKRAWDKRGRSEYWNNTVKKYGYIIDILEEGLSEEEAFEKEKWYIKRIGRENLVNMTDGGEGASGVIITDETKLKMSESKKGEKNVLFKKNQSEETKKKISISTKLAMSDPELRKKISERQKGNKNGLGYKHSEEARKKISEATKLGMNTEECRKKISESSKGRKHSEEARKKMGEASKLYWQNKNKTK
jgi:group I intron endonuclease